MGTTRKVYSNLFQFHCKSFAGGNRSADKIFPAEKVWMENLSGEKSLSQQIFSAKKKFQLEKEKFVLRKVWTEEIFQRGEVCV